MKFPIALSILAIAVSLNTALSQVVPVEVPIDEFVEEIPKEKFKLTKNMVVIDPIKGTCTLKKGQQLVYSAHVHGSVGYSASVSSSNSDALTLVDSFIEYDDDEQAELSGGDSATKYFIFDANKPGTYEVDLFHYFRGDLENYFTVTVTVEE